MMRAGASGAFRQRAIVLPAGSARKERPSPRAQTAMFGPQKITGVSPVSHPSLSILLPRATRSCGSGDRGGQRCAAARLCATPQKAAACTPLRTRRKAWCACTAAHDTSSPRAAPPPNHRNNPLTECFLCSSQTLAAARPTFAAGRRPLLAAASPAPPPESRPGCRPPAAMVALRALCAGLLVAVAAAVAPAPEPMRRRLQSTTICAADLSGRTRGVPDGRVNVMDVRPPPAKPGLRHAAWSRARLTTCVSARTNSCWSCWRGSASPATATTLPM